MSTKPPHYKPINPVYDPLARLTQQSEEDDLGDLVIPERKPGKFTTTHKKGHWNDPNKRRKALEFILEKTGTTPSNPARVGSFDTIKLPDGTSILGAIEWYTRKHHLPHAQAYIHYIQEFYGARIAKQAREYLGMKKSP